MLTDADLAYMREVQADHRPTAADLTTQTLTPDGLGGRVRAWGAPAPLAVRIDGQPDEIPANIADRFQGGTAYKITTDLVDIRSGDRLTVSATEVYEVVSDGDNDRWATAQVVWAQRVTFPAR